MVDEVRGRKPWYSSFQKTFERQQAFASDEPAPRRNPEIFELAGDFGRREMQLEKAKIEKALAAQEAKADMLRKARAPLSGKSHGVQQREMFGGDLFTNPKMKRKNKRTRSRTTPKSSQKRAAPSLRAAKRAASPSGFYHAIKQRGHVDVYWVTKGKPTFVQSLKPWELEEWAKRKGIAIK